jgi:hypothetical protein
MFFLKNFANTGEPSCERNQAFQKFFQKSGDFEGFLRPAQVPFLFISALKSRRRYQIFLSMPPFKYWWVFFLPRLKVVMDIRDGWSIAMASGYGGTTKKRPFKAFIARKIERLAIRRSYCAITCTPGLKDHLERVSGREVLLIPNGVSDLDSDLAITLKLTRKSEKSEGQLLTFCCAGKFSEYGKNKIENLIDVISERYSGYGYIIKLFGSDRECNYWVPDYVQKSSQGQGALIIIDRLGKKELYEEISKCDVGISVIRDPQYDFGTKVFDYIALGLPVLNYFSEPNSFTAYFNKYLDVPFHGSKEDICIVRSEQVKSELNKVLNL